MNVIRDPDFGEGTTRYNWWYPNVTVVMSYSGLEPGKEYNYRKSVKSLEGGISYGSTSTTYTVTASNTGSGTFTINCDIDPVNCYGLAEVEFELYDPDDDSKVYKCEPTGRSMQLYLYGVSDLKVRRADNDSMVGYGYLFENENDEAGVLIADTEVYTASPNTEYTLTATVRWIQDDGIHYMQLTDLQDGDGQAIRTTTTATSDEKGVVNFSYDLPTLKTAKAGEKYTLDLRVTGGGNTYTYSFNQMLLVNRYYGPYFGGVFFCYDKLEEPEEDPTYVNVRINDYIEGTNRYLAGSKLKLIKGTNPNGAEVIDEWEETGKGHDLSLEPGEYILVQTYAPDGYEIAKPKVIRLVDTDSDRRGNNFIAYTEFASSSSIGDVDIFHLKKDTDSPVFDTAYCINRGKTGPTKEAPIDFTTGVRLIYKEYDIEGPDFHTRLGTPRLSDGEINAAIKRVLYSGYPNDMSGIKDKYGLTNAEFADVTQDAVHYYTDSIDFSMDTYSRNVKKDVKKRLYEALMELVNATKEPPKGMTVKFYIPNSNSYQALISTEFKKSNIVIEANIYNAKPEEEHMDHESAGDDDDQDENDEHDGNKDKNVYEGHESDIGSVKTGDIDIVVYVALLAIATLLIGSIVIISNRLSNNRR